MSFMVLGYLIGIIAIPNYLTQQKALMLSALGGLVTVAALLVSDPQSESISALLWGWSGISTISNPVALVALLGLSNALVWPTIWPLALEGLGKFTAQGSALLIMAIAGGALLPLAFGSLSDLLQNTQSAYMVLIPCYVFILYYAAKGHTKRSW